VHRDEVTARAAFGFELEQRVLTASRPGGVAASDRGARLVEAVDTPDAARKGDRGDLAIGVAGGLLRSAARIADLPQQPVGAVGERGSALGVVGSER
jgi:hypothetical protein